MDRLRKRRDFLAAAKAERAGVASVLMQGRDRGDAGDVRVGFTVTKKTGNAVVRNRIRRRLREAVRRVLPDAGRPGFDYVLVAREAALSMPFDGLVAELERAVRKLHAPRAAKDSPRASKGEPRAAKNAPQPANDAPSRRGSDGHRPQKAHPAPGPTNPTADAADGDPPA